ncbi:hypothetical protein GCM10010430_10760 [Kitasatospora cystarginea]|uniref:Uncharacterized protein n=1 Tax=Kitasatospora cystarginea TaxID=58350 RepID=A0ABP5QD21_9ACTN
MSRIRAAAAVTALGAFLLAGIGSAQASNGTGSEPQPDSVVSDSGSTFDGDTGRQAGSDGGDRNRRQNRNHGLGDARTTLQGSADLDSRVYYPFVLY